MQWPAGPSQADQRHEAERFCGGAIDNFEDVEVHAQAELF